MSIKQFRLSAQAREQLIRLKTRTGINQWNILCRWAFCLSLRQPTSPTPMEIPSDSNVEMTWQVFGGEDQELYLALLKVRCDRDELGTSDDELIREFRLHLHRGINYLATPHAIRSIVDLVHLATEGDVADAHVGSTTKICSRTSPVPTNSTTTKAPSRRLAKKATSGRSDAPGVR
jgi:DNA sulfur modification protein DndE